jgi:serine/threonine protein kinase
LFTDPTPTDTDYVLKNYTIRSSFAKGSFCYVCKAIDKSGAPVAVKKIIANNKKQKLRVEDEIEVLRRITEDGALVRL